MATVFSKTVDDKCLVLSPREAILREMNIPTNWTDLSVAIGVSFTTVGDSNTIPASEIPVRFTVLDRFMFGIKDSGLVAPGVAGSRFVGVSDNAQAEFIPAGSGNPSRVTGGTLYDKVYSDGASLTTPSFVNQIMRSSTNDAASTAYFGWYGLRIVRGVTTSFYTRGSINQTDASDSSIYSFLAGDWTTEGSIPVDLRGWTELNSFYFRLPFYTLRARLHNYGYRVIS